MLQPMAERQFSQSFPSSHSTCAECGGPIEPERLRYPATRYCRKCALEKRRARVNDWKQRQIRELGSARFYRHYATCAEDRRKYMRDYMRARRAGAPKQPKA